MHKNVFKIICFYVAITLTSCQPTRESVSGVYIFIDKNNREFSEAVHLYQDGTYNYQFSTMMVPFPTLNGKWQISGRRVTLGQSNKIVDSLLSNDTIEVRKNNYKLSFGNLKRHMVGFHKYRTLKKFRKPFKRFILNAKPF